jgi:hypothetical protein
MFLCNTIRFLVHPMAYRIARRTGVSLISWAIFFSSLMLATQTLSAQPLTVQGVVQIRQPNGLTTGLANTRITAFIRTNTITDSASVLTNATGAYSLSITSQSLSTALATGSVTLRASRDGFRFAPESLVISSLLASASAGSTVTAPTFEAVTYSMGGTVTLNYPLDSLRFLFPTYPAGIALNLQLTTGATVVAATGVTVGAQENLALFRRPYSFSNIAPGTYVLRASVVGGTDSAMVFTPQNSVVRIIDSSLSNLNLTATPVIPRVAGRVLFNGNPFSNANIIISSLNSPDLTFAAQTGANGVFSIPAPVYGLYNVRLAQTGFSSNTPFVTVQWPLASSPVAVTLNATQNVGVISGFMQYRDTVRVGSIPSRPTLTLKADPSNLFPDVTTTIEAQTTNEAVFSYRYAFPPVPLGRYTVTPSSPDFAFVPQAVSVALAGDSVRAPDMTVFLALRTISGKVFVREATGVGALAGISVNIQSRTNTLNRTIVTGLDGSFAFAVPNGQYIVTVLGNATYFTIAPNAASVMIAGPNDDNTILPNFFMGRFPQIAYPTTGDVRLTNSVPITGVQIRAVQINNTSITSTATTNIRGVYTLNLTSATYTITPSLAGYTFIPPSRTVSIEENSRIVSTFSATLAPLTISGSIRTISGAAISTKPMKATVVTGAVSPLVLREIFFNTDSAGQYVVTLTGLLPEQRVLITAQEDPALRYGPVQRIISASPNDVLIRDTLRIGEQDFRALSTTAGVPLGTITGQITPPVAGVLVTDGTRSALSDSTGRYTIREVPNGPSVLTAFRAGSRFEIATSAVTVVVNPNEVRGTTNFQFSDGFNGNRPPIVLRVPGNPPGRFVLQAGRTQSIRLQSFITDPDSTQLFVSAFVDDPTVVRTRITGDNISIDPLWTGNPDPNITATASVTILVSDNQGGVTTATFRVVVAAPNEVPQTLVRSTVNGQYINTNHNAAIVIVRDALSTFVARTAAKPNESPTIATPVGRGDEFAAFNADDECVGSLVLSGEEDVLTVWSSEPESGVRGMQSGNRLRYEVIQGGDRRRKRITVGYLLGEPPLWPINGAIIGKTTLSTDGSFFGSGSQTVNVAAVATVNAFSAAPNPASGELTVQYELAASSAVRCELLNAFGQNVMTLVDGVQNAGRYRIRAATDELPSGLYVCRLQTRESAMVTRILLLR